MNFYSQKQTCLGPAAKIDPTARHLQTERPFNLRNGLKIQWEQEYLCLDPLKSILNVKWKAHNYKVFIKNQILSQSFPKAVFGSYSDFHVNNLILTHFRTVSCKETCQLFAVQNSSTKTFRVQLKFLKVVAFGMACKDICMFLSIF